MSRQIGIKEAKQRAGRFCAFRERSPKEVSDKLQKWGLSEPDSIEILNQLLKEGFVNPQRFANAFCHDKFEFNSWGRSKIRMYIRVHQLDSEIIENALKVIDEDKYQNRLSDLAKRKWNSLDGIEKIKRKQKTVAYLGSKGFEPDLIWSAVKKLT
ncbi:MAG: RecX family transcriptional regulator [Cyclobacteriaceae bacterium]